MCPLSYDFRREICPDQVVKSASPKTYKVCL